MLSPLVTLLHSMFQSLQPMWSLIFLPLILGHLSLLCKMMHSSPMGPLYSLKLTVLSLKFLSHALPPVHAATPSPLWVKI